jgi:hypothetical protein
MSARFARQADHDAQMAQYYANRAEESARLSNYYGQGPATDAIKAKLAAASGGAIQYYDGQAQVNKCNHLEGAFKDACVNRMVSGNYYDGQGPATDAIKAKLAAASGGAIQYYDGHAQVNKCNHLEGAFKDACVKRMVSGNYYDGQGPATDAIKANLAAASGGAIHYYDGNVNECVGLEGAFQTACLNRPVYYDGEGMWDDIKAGASKAAAKMKSGAKTAAAKGKAAMAAMKQPAPAAAFYEGNQCAGLTGQFAAACRN